MNWLRKPSIAKSLFSSFLLVLIPILFISFLLNYISMGIVKKQVNISYANSLNYMASQLDKGLKSLEVLSSALYMNSDINSLNYRPKEDVNTILGYASLLEEINFFQGTNDLDTKITIYLRNKGLSFSSRKGMDKIDEETKGAIKNTDPSSLTRWVFMKSNEYSKGESLSYTMNNVYTSPTSIVIKIEIGLLQIKKLLSDLERQTKGITFLIDSKVKLIYASNHSDIESQSLINRISEFTTLDGQFTLVQNKQRYKIIFFGSESTGLIYGLYFPDAVAMKPINNIKIWIVIIFILSLGLSILYTFLSYKNILKPINKLVSGMKSVKNGNFKLRIPEDHKDELGFIFIQFNKMVSQIDTLINEVYVERVTRQQIQLKFLQSQINPHFLYNCLNFIYQMSMAENTEGAARMALYLGKYFRFATKSNKDTVQLLEEIESIEAYMQIQKMRFSNKFDYYLDISEEIKKINIPRLIIQPMVENAFVHGLEDCDFYGHIWIRGWKNNNSIILTVEDDGKGIEINKLEELLKSLNDMEKKESSVGICNTHWRLVLKYGPLAGVNIEQRVPRGTKITLTIPFDEESEVYV